MQLKHRCLKFVSLSDREIERWRNSWWGWSNFLIPKIAIIEGEKFCGAIKAEEFGYIIGLDFFGYSLWQRRSRGRGRDKGRKKPESTYAFGVSLSNLSPRCGIFFFRHYSNAEICIRSWLFKYCQKKVGKQLCCLTFLHFVICEYTVWSLPPSTHINKICISFSAQLQPHLSAHHYLFLCAFATSSLPSSSYHVTSVIVVPLRRVVQFPSNNL